MRLDGSVASGSRSVLDALAGCGAGVAVAAFVRGRQVVDVWTDDLSGDSLVCQERGHRTLTGMRKG